MTLYFAAFLVLQLLFLRVHGSALGAEICRMARRVKWKVLDYDGDFNQFCALQLGQRGLSRMLIMRGFPFMGKQKVTAY